MAVRVARARKAGYAGTLAGVVLAGLMLVVGARGQQPAPLPAPIPAPTPLSKACQVGDNPTATEHPLPNVTEALKTTKSLRILTIGASGGLRGAKGSYIAQIEKLLVEANKGLQVVIINRGVSGELAADAARRIRIEVALNDPNLVLWQVGTNDALNYVPLDELAETVTSTVRWLKEHNVDVVLVGLQYVHPKMQDDNYRAVRELMRKVAAQENVVIVRRYEAMELIAKASGDDPNSVPDAFEQAENNYACLAQYVARAITLGMFGKGLRPLPPRPAPDPAPPPR